ncbi:hypothetical protein ACFXGA_09840 [Actinosynnema sp. NPDC059335]|uniref:hypothetical protein n=1 Tax=Actinosynnema sp. NPDC059335 TaxID=3346804 RepID=UPI00366B4580
MLASLPVACSSPVTPPATTTAQSSATSSSDPAIQPVVTVRGTVREGAETGCLVLDAGERRYLLLDGDPRELPIGAEVVVRGRPAPGGVTTCQEGVPFHVVAVTPTP